MDILIDIFLPVAGVVATPLLLLVLPPNVATPLGSFISQKLNDYSKKNILGKK